MSLELTKNDLPSIFSVKGDFVFPYLYKFAGQDKNEKILYLTREDKAMLYWRLLGAVGLSGLIIVLLLAGGNYLIAYLPQLAFLRPVLGGLCFLVGAILLLSLWWIKNTWRKTIGLVTTYRLVKIVQITPWTNRVQTLALKEIVDTSSETRHLTDALLGLSTLTARSSATSSGLATNDSEGGRINKKYFYFENIKAGQDLENYLNKLLHLLPETNNEKMMTFRPFLPFLKGEARRRFMANYPQYWS